MMLAQGAKDRRPGKLERHAGAPRGAVQEIG